MDQVTDAQLVDVLRARCDALTWVCTTLIQSHPGLKIVRAQWHARRFIERAGGMEGLGMDYRQAYLEEISAWTMTLEALVVAPRPE